jgi:hypothetical protein
VRSTCEWWITARSVVQNSRRPSGASIHPYDPFAGKIAHVVVACA